MQIKALQFLDKQIQESYKHVKTAGYSQILYLYTRSIPGYSINKGIGSSQELSQSTGTSWPKLSLYEKALTAITMERYGKTDIAKQIICSLERIFHDNPLKWECIGQTIVLACSRTSRFKPTWSCKRLGKSKEIPRTQVNETNGYCGRNKPRAGITTNHSRCHLCLVAHVAIIN